MDISMVDRLPCIFCLSSSASLASLWDFLPGIFKGLSKDSSSEDPEFSGGLFLSVSM
jgi:hypothetical protein